MKSKPIQCEGWYHTPAFVLGGEIGWHQCRADAIWNITFKREGEERTTLPGCEACKNKLSNGKDDPVIILKIERITDTTKPKPKFRSTPKGQTT